MKLYLYPTTEYTRYDVIEMGYFEKISNFYVFSHVISYNPFNEDTYYIEIAAPCVHRENSDNCLDNDCILL